jgi:hypothetical protein
MIEHLVLLRARPAFKQADWIAARDHFLSLKQSVPGIIELSIGENISPGRNLGYTHALRVLFRDESSLKVYADHPEHTKFKQLFPFDSDDNKAGFPRSCALDYLRD